MDVTQRFTNRVGDYIKYRPKYPAEIITVLKQHIALDAGKTIADVGAGTGFSSELFLQNGNPVFAIEPNDAMRDACKKLYGHFNNLTIINGTAENTSLPDASVDVILAGTAFHWFNREKCKPEFERILKPGGHIVLMWNIIKTDTEFSKGYENLLVKYGTDYKTVSTRNIGAADIAAFLHPKKMQQEILINSQAFDLEGISGRLASSSFVPKDGAAHTALQQGVTALFHQYAENGTIAFNYDTKIYWC